MAILAAIDENERSKRVVSVSYSLAKAYDTELIALHVIPGDEFNKYKESLKNIKGFSDFSVMQEEESAKRFAREFVMDTVDNIDGDMLETRGRVGDVTTEILNEVDATNPQYLVISGRRRSPVGKAVFGNTAQQLLLNASCPVVTRFSDQ